MLSAGATLTSAGTLLVTGTDAPDTITVRVSGPQVVVHANGSMLQFPRGDVRRLRIVGGAGDDVLTNKTRLRSTLDGGAGDDRLHGGTGDDTLIGGLGSNRLATGNAGVTLVDQSGSPSGGFSFGLNDLDFSVSMGGGQSTDTLYGGGSYVWRLTDGNDSVSGDIGRELTIDAGAGDDVFRGFMPSGLIPGSPFFDLLGDREFEATLIGGEGKDRWFTDELSNRLLTIIGGPGNDVVEDLIQLVGAYERIDLGAGRDSVFVGDDILGPPIVYAGAGVEYVQVTKSARMVYGNSLNNTIDVELANVDGVTVFGGRGDDVITSGGFPASVVGGAGNDRLTGAGTLVGGSGNDTLVGGDFSEDLLEGGDGDDVFFARDGRRDTIRGGAGADRATADTVGSVIDLISEVEEVS